MPTSKKTKKAAKPTLEPKAELCLGGLSPEDRDNVNRTVRQYQAEERFAAIAKERPRPEDIMEAVQDMQFDPGPMLEDEDDEDDEDDEVSQAIRRSVRLRDAINATTESLSIAEEVVDELEAQFENRNMEQFNSDECLGCRITDAIVGHTVRTALSSGIDSLPVAIVAASAVAEYYGIPEEHVIRGVTKLWYKLDVRMV